MIFDGRSVDEISDAEVRSLLGKCERQHLEFKLTINTTDDEDRLELLKDIASLANGGGGYIVVGVRENRDTAQRFEALYNQAGTREAAPMKAPRVETFRAESDGCVGYLVVDEASGEALAIDPRLDQVDRFLETARAKAAVIRHVLDTHTHADHLSGARRLAELAGATRMAHPASRAQGIQRRVSDGEVLKLGSLDARAIHSPGHTPDSLSLLVDGNLFTGDALFVEGAGRTDFPGGSASDLYDTFRKLEALADSTLVRPGHDYTGRPTATMGEVKRQNSLFRERDRQALIRAMDRKGDPPPGMQAILAFNLGELDPGRILPAELDARLRGGDAPRLVDVRTPMEFESERIEGAILLPLSDLESRLSEIPAGGEVVLICATGVRATMAAPILLKAAREARVLEGGLAAWKRAGLALKLGRKRLSIDRQVQLVVGTGVLTGVLLGAFVHPGFLVLSAFFGGGLAFAGLTGTCGMAMLLMRMPWNRLPVKAGGSCAVGGAPSKPAASCAVGGSPPAS